MQYVFMNICDDDSSLIYQASVLKSLDITSYIF